MGLFDFLKNNNVSSNLIEEKENTIIAPFPFDTEKLFLKDLTEKQYDSLYNKFDNACEKFSESASDVEFEFAICPFEYDSRVKLLRKACKNFEKCFDIVAPYWYEDTWFMEMLELSNPEKWTKNEFENIMPGSIFEIDNNVKKYHFMNINFLRWLLSEYENKKYDLINYYNE